MNKNFRTIQPSIFPLQALQIPNIELYEFQNGIKLKVLNDNQMELMRFDIKFKAGVRYQSKMFIASFTAKMMFEGTAKYSSTEIAEMFDSKGAYYGISPELDNVNVSFYIPKIYFSELLPLIYDVLFESVFPDDELEKLKRKEEMSLRVNFTKTAVLARYHVRNVLFGDQHPYGLFPVLENIQNLNRDDLFMFHRQFYAQSVFSLYLTGNVDLDIRLAVENVFGFIKVAEKDENQLNCSPKLKPNVDIALPDAVQRSIRLARLSILRSHPDFVDLGVLSTILGGYFGSRLMTNIREEKGYTYGIGSSVVSLQNASYLAIYSDVGKDVWELALKEIEFEMLRLCDERVGQKELERVKQYLAGSMMRSVDGAVNLIDKLIDLDDYGLSISYLQSQMDAIHAVDSSRLQELAQIYLNPTEYSKVLVG